MAVSSASVMGVTREDTRNRHVPFLDCVASFVKDGNLSIELYKKPTHKYLLFDFHHPLEHKLGFIWTLAGPEGSLQHRGKAKGIDTHQDHAPDMWLP